MEHSSFATFLPRLLNLLQAFERFRCMVVRPERSPVSVLPEEVFFYFLFQNRCEFGPVAADSARLFQDRFVKLRYFDETGEARLYFSRGYFIIPALIFSTGISEAGTVAAPGKHHPKV